MSLTIARSYHLRENRLVVRFLAQERREVLRSSEFQRIVESTALEESGQHARRGLPGPGTSWYRSGMARRTPSRDVVAALPREEWENLCAGICALVFQTHRVEDRRGRGNGMDDWRAAPGGIEGFQHRRLDNRLGEVQVRDLKENIGLAVRRCASEMGRPLVTYNVLLNIDLEPGHHGAMGEIERWSELENWARSNHQLSLVLNSLTWVHARLLQFPGLRPDLFEDIAAAVSDARAALEELGDSTKAGFRKLQELLAASSAAAELKAALELLAGEARVHFDRGLAAGNEEEYRRAIVSLEDARRLLAPGTVDERLHGHVLTVLCGIKVLVGRLVDGLADGERAVAVLDRLRELGLARIARGNVAMALYRLQRYGEARHLCEKLVGVYEQDGNLLELVRNLQHLAEMSCNQRDLESAQLWSERLFFASNALVEVRGGIDALTVGALGTAANVFMLVAETLDQELEVKMLLHAHQVLLRVEEMATELKSPMTVLLARLQRAKALWNLEALQRAADLFAAVVAEASHAGFAKVAADGRFNRAMVLTELGEKDIARAEFAEARRSYSEMGDPPSVDDVDRMIKRLKL